MYLLYLDGSGSVKNPNEQHFVLAGVGVYERQIYHLITKADDFIASLGYGSVHDVELHASAIASGKTAPWKGTPRQERLGLIERSLSLLRDAHHSVRAFAVVVDKQAYAGDPVEYAFEENGIVKRFDRAGGVIHGLVHRRAGAPGDCSCPACMSRSWR